MKLSGVTVKILADTQSVGVMWNPSKGVGESPEK